MPEPVRITDVAPRDGLQNEPGVIPTEEKAELVRLLGKTGVDEVEVTSFVSPKWVPQLADAAELLEALRQSSPSQTESVGRRADRPKQATGVGRPRDGSPTSQRSASPVWSALVPNERGLQGVLDANARAGSHRISKVALFTAASETFCKRNINATIAESIARFVPVIVEAKRAGLRVRGYVSCAIACPFEGPISPRAVVDVAGRLIDAGIDELDLGDTIGAGTPESVAAVLRATSRVHAITEPETFTLHLHDTFAHAAECVKAALDLGVRSFDGSVAGLGGCPYASTPGRRAPGNISTQTLVGTVHGSGYRTGVDIERLEEAGRFATKIVAAARLRAANSSDGGTA